MTEVHDGVPIREIALVLALGLLWVHTRFTFCLLLSVFYWPAGHTAWSEEDSAFLDFNPEADFKVVMDHIARKAGPSA